MKLALLGADHQSVALANAAVGAGHHMTWCGNLGPLAAECRSLCSGGDQAAKWEDLVDLDVADAVIVGRGGDEQQRLDQVKELVQLGRPLLTTFPLFRSVLSYYEVDLARADGGAALCHFNPIMEHPLVDQTARLLRDGYTSLGAVEQVVCERFMAERSPELVLQRFACDVELLQRIAGRLDRIGAHAAAVGDAAYGALSLQLLGNQDVPVRWSVQPPSGGAPMQLTVVCKRGRLVMVFDAEDCLTSITENSESGNRDEQIDDFSAAVAISRQFIDEWAPTAATTWPDALHAMELADSVEISLRRGRMIDVHQQQLTERLAFRGTMSALGCGLLLVLPPILLLVGWIAGGLGIGVARYWPHALLSLLAFFLAVQLLPRLLLPERSRNGAPKEP